jgi:hypothetical protein
MLWGSFFAEKKISMATDSLLIVHGEVALDAWRRLLLACFVMVTAIFVGGGEMFRNLWFHRLFKNMLLG